MDRPAGASGGAADATLVAWQDYFADPKLRPVVELALQNSCDMRMAALNTEKAAALCRIQRSDLFSGVGTGVTADMRRVPEKVSGKASAVPACGWRSR